MERMNSARIDKEKEFELDERKGETKSEVGQSDDVCGGVGVEHGGMCGIVQ